MTLRAGDVVDATMQRTSGNLEPFMRLVDKDGRVVAWDGFEEARSSLKGTVRASGTYYLVTGGWTIIYLDTGEVVRTEGELRPGLHRSCG
jgi:hypothetical protein